MSTKTPIVYEKVDFYELTETNFKFKSKSIVSTTVWSLIDIRKMHHVENFKYS